MNKECNLYYATYYDKYNGKINIVRFLSDSREEALKMAIAYGRIKMYEDFTEDELEGFGVDDCLGMTINDLRNEYRYCNKELDLDSIDISNSKYIRNK